MTWVEHAASRNLNKLCVKKTLQADTSLRISG